METASAASGVLWVALIWIASILTASANTPAPAFAVAAVADGPPFEFVRGARLFDGSRGTHLSAGDLITTGPKNLLVLEFMTDSRLMAAVALGPSSRIYWMNRADGVTFAVLAGWIKVDTVTPGQLTWVHCQGARLRASSAAGIYVMHVSEAGDEVFHEIGSMTLELGQPSGRAAAGLPSRPEQLTRRGDAGLVQTRLAPDDTFVNALPAAFIDPLPMGLGGQHDDGAQPQLVRDVTYEDVADWLAAPIEWRRGFVRRFRTRIKDPLFFRALDARMSAHPEWGPILHPPEAALTLPNTSSQQ